jgi:diguanylate cyclase (GGDEF)-like protein/PAS domain S-box-containing protein
MGDSLRVLLVEDDEDDYILTRGMLRRARPGGFEIDWERSHAAALNAIHTVGHDLYLIDYRLGDRTGLDLVRDAWAADPPAPVILLTGQDEHEVDVRASELGVTDYLVKGTIDAPTLERAIRYARRHHQAMVELRRSEERYAVAARATNDGIWDWDLRAGTVHFSERWKALVGCEELVSDRPDAWLERVHPDDLGRLRRDIEDHLAGTSPHFESEHRFRCADGRWSWMLTRGLATRDAGGAPIRLTGSLSDVTERRQAQERLIHDAQHDALTGLPNRSLLMDRVAQCLGELEPDCGHGCAVLHIDVDRFKLVNESLSHADGDRLLVVLARRVEDVVHRCDTLARVGGDEFTVLVTRAGSAEEVLEIASRVGHAIAGPISFGEQTLSVSASIGIAHTLDGVVDPEDLVRNADIAMHDAKARGGGSHEVFDPSMHRRVIERLSLESELRDAIESGRLRTFLQPIVDLRTGALHGLEALARWPAGARNITPAEFIPVAEDCGLIGALGALVLERSCQTLSDWQRRGVVAPEVTVSVNVSIRQLTHLGFVEQVRAALSDADLPAANLVLEITESTLMENPELVSAVLRELIELGVTVELDDFGTGYSSLTVLRDFPGDTLKIDRGFVDNMTERPEADTIVRSIVGLAHNLGLGVIAEGIESHDQLAALVTLGCEYGQGYFFGRPLPVGELEAVLRAGDGDAPAMFTPRTIAA